MEVDEEDVDEDIEEEREKEEHEMDVGVSIHSCISCRLGRLMFDVFCIKRAVELAEPQTKTLRSCFLHKGVITMSIQQLLSNQPIHYKPSQVHSLGCAAAGLQAVKF